MTQAFSKITIHAPTDAVWQVIGDFGAAGQYLAGVVDCTVEGQEVGALRTLTSADGSAIVERLETLDATSPRLSYALLTDTPFGDCLTTMAVRAMSRTIRNTTMIGTGSTGRRDDPQRSTPVLVDQLARRLCAFSTLTP